MPRRPTINRLLCLIAAMLAPSAARAARPGVFKDVARTTKSLDAFGKCFVAAQERASRAWSFVPSKDGGTFSDVGSPNNQIGYFLHIQGSGPAFRLRLEWAGTERSAIAPILNSVDHCV